MAENLADEIRNQEALAKKTVTDAKAEAGKVVASANAEAEQLIKSTKQQCHRQWRESVAAAEKEAEGKAEDLLAKGKVQAKEFYEGRKSSVSGVADVLVEEVMATYGSGRDV